MAKYKNGKRVTFYTVLGKIGDILLWPILIISLLSSFFMLVQRKQNKITSVFGYSFVNVLSPSMVKAGFNVHDTVIVKHSNERDVKLGDVIAFYYSSSTKSPSDPDMHLVMRYSNYTYPIDASDDNITINYAVNLSNYPKKVDNSKEYLEKAQKDKARVYFHQVVAIYVDDDGNLFFETKGSNNGASDSPLSRGDLLVGKYVNTPIFVRRVVTFCATPIGMILLVCFPLSLLVLMQCLSLIDQISIIALEKRLMAGQVSYKDDAVKKDLAGNQIELYNKVYYYFIMPPEEKEDVKQYLWGDLLSTPVLPDKKKEELSILNRSLKKLETSDDEYWNEWIACTKGSNKKQLIALRKQLIAEGKIKISPKDNQEGNDKKTIDVVEQKPSSGENLTPTTQEPKQKKLPKKLPSKKPVQETTNSNKLKHIPPKKK